MKHRNFLLYFLFFYYFYSIRYWTDWGFYPKIEKANMAGKGRGIVVDSGLYWPNGLTLDKEKNRLYWVDASYDKLEYLDLYNNSRVTLISSSIILPHPFGLTLLGDYLYWTDWQRDTVYRANKDGAGDVTAFITGVGQPMDIHGYDLTKQMTPGTYNNFVVTTILRVCCLLSLFVFFPCFLSILSTTSNLNVLTTITRYN